MRAIELPTNSPDFKSAPPIEDDFWKEIQVDVDFSIIGAAKSGTSWLFYLLNQHPDIFIPGEQNVFTLYQNKGGQYYNTLYKHAKTPQILGDYSNSYMLDQNLPYIFARKYANIKLIMVCRNPVKRAFSHYLMDITNKRFKPEQISFREALLSPQTYSYYDIGLYFKHIQRYLQHIPKQQFCIITLDEMRQSPKNAVNKVFDFLGIHRLDALSSEGSINSWQSNRIHKSSVMAVIRKVAKKIVPLRLHNKFGLYYMTLINRIAHRFTISPRPTISEKDKTLLQAKYYHPNRELEALVNIDVSSWDV